MLLNATRRTLLAAAAGAPLLAGCNTETTAPAPTAPRFQISLAQWSLHKRFYGGTFAEAMAGRSREDFIRAMHEAPDTAFRGEAKPVDFPIIAKQEFGIEAVEYVNRF